ncbi:MAG: molybdopterin molybdenumtransferase MoeA, partial [Halomonadaceae bacterium]
MSELMNPDDALAQLLALAPPPVDQESLATGQALGRILAQPVTADVTVPPSDNSAVDGYAIRFTDFQADQPLPVSQRIPAGAGGGGGGGGG